MRNWKVLLLAVLSLLPACIDQGPGGEPLPDAGIPGPDSGTPDAGPPVNSCANWSTDAGPAPETGSTADAGCQPRTCDQLAANCGTVSDGCGGTLTCGTCIAPDVCGGRGLANTCATPPSGRWCSEDGWCWESPFPHGYTLRGAHFRAADDGWAVGDDGHIQHWNGTNWTRVPSGTRTGLYDVLALSASDVWMVGSGGTVLRSSGTAFSPVSSGTSQELRSIWASGPSDIWTVGRNGTVLRNQGSGFQSLPANTSQTLNSVWGSGPGDVWMVGQSGTVRHYDGASVVSIDAGTTLPLYEVTGTGPADVWAVTSEDPCFFCDDYGVVYRVTPDGLSENLHIGDQLYHVFAAGPSAVLTVGEGARYQWNGTGWQSRGSGGNGLLAGSGPNDVWLLGHGGRLERWDGTKWTMHTASRSLALSGDLHGSNANNVWMVGSSTGQVLQWSGGGWYQRTAFSDTFPKLTGVYAASPSAVWFVTAGPFDDDENRIYRWNGTNFVMELASSSQGLNAVHGSSEQERWAVGGGGLALHGDGSGWRCEDTGVSAMLRGVWVHSPSLAIAVGNGGTIVHWNGSTWSKQNSGTQAELHGVWGSGPTDIWAAGADGTLLHYDGSTWSPVASGTTSDLNSIRGVSPTAVWAAGANGTLLRFDGTTWTSERTGTTRNLRGVWASSESDVWLAGDSAVLHKP